MQEAIYPGKPWYDTEGRRIQAHGGAIFQEDGVYYWYGENKEKTDGKNDIWTWGISCYRSSDLCNWENLGLIIPPVLDDPASPLAPQKRVDRPHILKNPRTGKYVCWIKLSGDDACFVVLTADRLTGPYELVRQAVRPQGKKVGDFDLFQAKDGNAYVFFDGDHAGVFCSALTEDYLDLCGELTVQYPDLHAPFTREGVTVFSHGGKFYMLTSGMTGYIPNRSDSAVADNILGPYVPLGDPHVEDASRASFNSQISQVFPLPGENCFLVLADRWVPEYVVDARKADILERAIASHFEPEKYQVSMEEKMEMRNSPMLASANTSIADYVWLPMSVVDGKPQIRWLDSWRP